MKGTQTHCQVLSCKFFEEWDRDLGFLMMPRVVSCLYLRLQPQPLPSPVTSYTSVVLSFSCLPTRPCLSSSVTTSGDSDDCLLTARQAVSFSVWLTELQFSDMGTNVLRECDPPQTQSTAWPGQSQALSSPFHVMVEHGHMTILASSTELQKF